MHRALIYFGSMFNKIIMIILDVSTWYDLIGLNCQKRKIYRFLWDVFLMLWILLGLGHDMDCLNWPVCFASKITWTLRLGGFLFVLTNTKDLHKLCSFLELFNSSFRLISSYEIDSVVLGTYVNIVCNWLIL